MRKCVCVVGGPVGWTGVSFGNSSRFQPRVDVLAPCQRGEGRCPGARSCFFICLSSFAFLVHPSDPPSSRPVLVHSPPPRTYFVYTLTGRQPPSPTCLAVEDNNVTNGKKRSFQQRYLHRVAGKGALGHATEDAIGPCHDPASAPCVVVGLSSQQHRAELSDVQACRNAANRPIRSHSTE
jgi:hypothetical protein